MANPTGEIALTHDEKWALDHASCPRHQPGTETFICSPCASAQNMVIEHIISTRLVEARASALREAAEYIRFGLDTSNSIGKGAEMACRMLDDRADKEVRGGQA